MQSTAPGDAISQIRTFMDDHRLTLADVMAAKPAAQKAADTKGSAVTG